MRREFIIERFSLVAIIIFVIGLGDWAQGARLKDISQIRGVRPNQLIGYGIVVGLKGTGDGKLEYTNQSIKRMLDKLGMKVGGDEKLATSNVAAVIVTATLPPFSRAGNKLDITVNSLGDAASLEGGTLLQTPLRASDKQVYAVAQGALSMGGSDHLTVGKIPNGAIIEKDMDSDFTNRKMYRWTLNEPDLTTAARVAKTINLDLGGKYATAVDPTTVDLVVPFAWEGKGVELLSIVEALEVFPDGRAKVVINEKTGSVVIGEKVRIRPVAISHGDLSVEVKPLPSSGPELKAPRLRGPASEQPDPVINRVHLLAGDDGEVNVGELVRGLNKMGVSPKDLISILQNIKASGALQADLEIF